MSATELFKVVCVTCQAKLSVRNQSLIGQIVACPRCSSMVEVHAPAETSKPSQAAAMAAAAVVAPAVAPESPVEPTAAEMAQTPADLPPVPQTPTSATPPPEAPPLAEATIAATANAGQFKMIALAIGGFILGAAVVGGVLLSSGDSPDEVTMNETARPVNNSDNNDVPLTVETPAVEAPTAETPAPVESPVIETPTPTIDEFPVNPPTVEPVVEVVEQPEPITPPEQASESPSNEVIVTSPELPTETQLIDQKFDPLEFDPANLSLASINQPKPPSMSADIEEAPPAEPVDLPEVKATELPLVRMDPNQTDDAGSRDAKKQLTLLVPGVQIEGLPLVDCLRQISQLSGVPVSVSPEQLLMAGFSPLKSVSIEVSEISLGELLSQTLAPLRLVHEADGSHIVIKRKGSANSREISYRIDDLINGTTDIEQIATWIEQLVAPQTWKATGGEGMLTVTDGKLQITQTQQVQYQVLIFLERLRLARNLPQSSRFPIKRLTGQAAHQAIAKQLAASTTFTFSQYTPLEEIFVHWQTELGVAVLVDWPVLADEKLWPSTRIACSIVDQSWDKALTQTLEPLGLGWRATPGGAIEITSLEKVQNELLLEIYPLGNQSAGNAQALLDRLRARTRRSSGSGGLMLFDPVGKSILALQPAVLQREVVRELGGR